VVEIDLSRTQREQSRRRGNDGIATSLDEQGEVHNGVAANEQF
jgi:hypothetical protein